MNIRTHTYSTVTSVTYCVHTQCLLSQFCVQYLLSHSVYSTFCHTLCTHLQNPAAWATLGHIHYLSGDLKEAQPAFERALAFVGDCPEIHSVHLRVGDIYLQSNQVNKWALPCHTYKAISQWHWSTSIPTYVHTSTKYIHPTEHWST